MVSSLQKKLKQNLLSKCWACSIRNWDPCSHCRSKSWSKVWGIVPPPPPNTDESPLPPDAVLEPVLLALAFKKNYKSHTSCKIAYFLQIEQLDGAFEAQPGWDLNRSSCCKCYELPTRYSSGPSFFDAYSRLDLTDCPTYAARLSPRSESCTKQSLALFVGLLQCLV